MTPIYIIKANWISGTSPAVGYVQINEKISTEIQIVTTKTQASQIASKVLAQGWLLKAEIDYPSYQFTIIQSL